MDCSEKHGDLIAASCRLIRGLKLYNDEPTLRDAVLLIEDVCNIDSATRAVELDLLTLTSSQPEQQHQKPQEVAGKDDAEFAGFCNLLKKRGYLDESAPDYTERLGKARQKFDARRRTQPPTQKLTADELKLKGNAHMSQANYRDAIQCYTKAIELSPENHILYANRAAAETHLKDYKAAAADCEKSIAIEPTYSKAFARLGTALTYDEDLSGAVEAYERAVELDPQNQRYKNDLGRAREMFEERTVQTTATSQAGPGGVPSAGGMPDMANAMSMLNNPQFMQMAGEMMKNPEFMNMAQNFSSRMMAQNADGSGGAPSMPTPQQLESAMAMAGNQTVDEDGNVQTPFGKIKQDDLQALRAEEAGDDSEKMRAIQEDVRLNGPTAFSKYMNDPDVMAKLEKFSRLINKPQ